MKNIRIYIVSLAIILPLSILAYMFMGHAAFDDILNYAPTLDQLYYVLLVVAVVILSVVYDLKVKKNKTISNATIIISCVSLLLAAYLTNYVIVPKYIRHGKAPAINFIKNDNKISAIRFAAGGDAHIGNTASRTDLTLKMLNHISADKYNMFFLLGDIADLGFNDSYWKRALNTIKDFNNKVPMWFIPGNHDTMFGGDSLYRLYVLPNKNDTLWHRIDKGNVHFLVLDVEWGTQTYTKAQEKWLIEQLKSIPHEDWCIVMSHTFYYASGGVRDGWEWYDNKLVIAKLVPLFEKYGVDLVMSGHIHQTEVLKKNGITYVIVGSLGGKLDRQKTYTSPASVWFKHGQYGFADVIINGSGGTVAIRDPENKVLFRTTLKNN